MDADTTTRNNSARCLDPRRALFWLDFDYQPPHSPSHSQADSAAALPISGRSPTLLLSRALLFVRQAAASIRTDYSSAEVAFASAHLDSPAQDTPNAQSLAGDGGCRGVEVVRDADGPIARRVCGVVQCDGRLGRRGMALFRGCVVVGLLICFRVVAHQHQPRMFSHLTFLLTLVASLLTAMASFLACVPTWTRAYPAQHALLLLLATVAFQISLSNALFVDLAFWLSPLLGDKVVAFNVQHRLFSTAIFHGLNLIIPLTDMMLSNVVFRPVYITAGVFSIVVYGVAVMLPYKLLYGRWVYRLPHSNVLIAVSAVLVVAAYVANASFVVALQRHRDMVREKTAVPFSKPDDEIPV